MCVTNTCNHSRRALKIAPQHLTVKELHRVKERDGEEQETDDLPLSSRKRLEIGKDLVIVSPVLDDESRRSSALSNTTEATTATDEEEDSCSSFLAASTRAGGCLKVRTQAQSLARKYAPSAQHQIKHVDWDMVEFRTHNTVLANNPAVSWGAPIGIGDEMLLSHCLGIDEYEKQRPPRRNTDALRVPRDVRERTLMSEGYSRSEILQVTLEMDRIRNRRERVATGGPVRKIQTLVLRRCLLRKQSVLGKRAKKLGS